MRLNFEQLQREQTEWAQKNFGQQDWTDAFIGITEELGELAHSLLKEKQGIRGTHEEHEAAAKDAVGDMLVFMANFCELRGWSMQDIIEECWGIVKQRDWEKDPTGKASPLLGVEPGKSETLSSPRRQPVAPGGKRKDGFAVPGSCKKCGGWWNHIGDCSASK